MPKPPDDEDPHRLFLEHRELIERAIEFVARRLHPDEREDFSSWVIVRLLENDCAILRKCRDWSQPRSFIGVVVNNLYRDYLNHERGKFRSSKEAKALGKTAILLERLTVREGLTFDEACQFLLTNYKVKETPAELIEIAKRLPVRFGRHFEGEDVLPNQPSTEDPPDVRIVAAERKALGKKVLAALERALDKLDAEDRALLDYHFNQGWTWAEVARYLQLDQKRLYTRVERILGGLGKALEAEGFGGESLREVLLGAGLAFRQKKRPKK